MTMARTMVSFWHVGLPRGSLDNLLGCLDAGVWPPRACGGGPLSLSFHSGFDKKHHTQTVTDLRETVKKMLWSAFVDMLVWHGVPE